VPRQARRNRTRSSLSNLTKIYRSLAWPAGVFGNCSVGLIASLHSRMDPGGRLHPHVNQNPEVSSQSIDPEDGQSSADLQRFRGPGKQDEGLEKWTVRPGNVGG
jgi:hypothetical protein